MLELKVLESSDFTEVVVYGNYLYKLRTKWMLQSMAERHRLRQERGGRPFTRWSGAGAARGQLHSLSFSPSSYPSFPILSGNHHPHLGHHQRGPSCLGCP